MKKLDKLVLIQFLPWFLGMLALSTMGFFLFEILQHLQQYMEKDIPFFEVMAVHLYYLPKAFSISLSLSLLFATSFCFGTLGSNNELIAVHSSGISLFRFSMPILILGALLSIGQFFFEENIVIPSLALKNNRQLEYLGPENARTNLKAILDQGGGVIYFFDFYNENDQRLFNPVIILRDPNTGQITSRIDANTAQWNGDNWELDTPRIFDYNQEDQIFTETFSEKLSLERLDEDPKTFGRGATNLEEMTIPEAWKVVEELRNNGLPYLSQITEIYQRFSFVLTPFMVVFFAIPLGSRQRKNVLFLSLALSLVGAITYYFFHSYVNLLAGGNRIPPVTAPFIQLTVGLGAGFYLFRTARN